MPISEVIEMYRNFGNDVLGSISESQVAQLPDEIREIALQIRADQAERLASRAGAISAINARWDRLRTQLGERVSIIDMDGIEGHPRLADLLQQAHTSQSSGAGRRPTHHAADRSGHSALATVDSDDDDEASSDGSEALSIADRAGVDLVVAATLGARQLLALSRAAREARGPRSSRRRSRRAAARARQAESQTANLAIGTPTTTEALTLGELGHPAAMFPRASASVTELTRPPTLIFTPDGTEDHTRMPAPASLAFSAPWSAATQGPTMMSPVGAERRLLVPIDASMRHVVTVPGYISVSARVREFPHLSSGRMVPLPISVTTSGDSRRLFRPRPAPASTRVV
ncbi:hypothetical protein FNF27_04040 [Cafeteria roenbergensis]|uniref:Uncharacterized protein n=1 Tax=Cafeteria roenbergensis TaxID=33653 RepID=A0A5A8E9V4_CAFRO|nr:hypothetical protein FNF27_04040 [Cafeteria roenbergensis]